MPEELNFIWNDTDNLGLPIIDEQHRAIFSLFSSLYHFSQNGKSEGVFEAALNTLDQYIQIHFITEEGLVGASSFPELSRHISRHRQFAKDMKRMLAVQRGASEAADILHYLGEWWLDHIRAEDRKFVSYLLETEQSRQRAPRLLKGFAIEPGRP